MLIIIETPLIFRPLEKKVTEALGKIRLQNQILEREKANALKAAMAKTNFVANMSHELRTPLNAIIGFTDCLLANIYGPLKTKQQQKCVQDIRDSGAHLLGLVNDLLDTAAAEPDAIKLYEEDVLPADVLRAAVSTLKLVAEKAVIDVGGDPDNDLG